MSAIPPSSIEPMRFREVLGHFPTGVSVITAIDADGKPVGMAVGSFTSVSLDPPLVAFLPDRSSSTFPRIREAKSFCVNVLSATQEPVCRGFARKGDEKFDGVGWRAAPSGAPIIDDVVAWIDCTIEDVHEAGDHFIVIGRVGELEVANPTLPLLFFQGGYGAFALKSVVMGAHDGLTDKIVLADRVRDEVEQLARATKTEVQVFAGTEDSLVLVTSATPNSIAMPSRVGIRLPLVPPAGRLFVAWEDRDAIEVWYSRSPHPLDAAHIDAMDLELEHAREYGWIPTMHSEALDDVWLTVGKIAELGQTPGLVRNLDRAVTSLGSHSDPADITAETAGNVQALSAPVFGADGKVALMLTVIGITQGSSLEQVMQIKKELVAAARRASTRIGGA